MPLSVQRTFNPKLATGLTCFEAMAALGRPFPMDDDTSSSEGRFGNRRVKEYSGWASATAIIITIIVIGLVFYFRVNLVGL
jgi:hypothetical protein